jgi:hypothetical protein
MTVRLSTQFQALVREGFESGEAVELTPEPMDEIEREAEHAYRRREKPGPRVRPWQENTP